MSTAKHFKNFIFASALITVEMTALAAPAKKPSKPSERSSSAGKDFVISSPVLSSNQSFTLHGEYNLLNQAGLAVEIGALNKTERLSDDEVEETGNSFLIEKGMQASLLLSRYSEPASLGGFFWTLGAGYRQFSGNWKKKPNDDDRTNTASSGLRLVSGDGYYHHEIQGQGMTAHGRVGYRWVSADWPVLIGAHIGLRHFDATFKKVEATEKEDGTKYSALSDEEAKSIRRSMMTEPDIAIEFGMAF